MSSTAWKKENTVQILLRIVKSSGVPDALQKMTEETGENATVYIRRVVSEALKRDGFLKEEETKGD